MKKWLILGWVGVMASAFAVITVRHQHRLAFVAWQQAESAKLELQYEQGRLLLEKATWAQRRNIVDEARKRLAMRPPAPDEIVTLKLRGGSVSAGSASLGQGGAAEVASSVSPSN